MFRLRVLCCGGLAAVALMVSGCAVSPEARAGRELAETVKVKGYRKVYDRHPAAGTELYFIGPPGVDLSKAVSARNWSPEPPSSGLPDTGLYKRVAEGSANTDKHACRVVVSTLRPGYEPPSVELSKKEQQDVADGKQVYVRVTCYWAGAP
jgi:hypothetical protein